tara:strand:- start:162 stop:335 length:174 start_codon:yes stop_codon:yes gene_type:complete
MLFRNKNKFKNTVDRKLKVRRMHIPDGEELEESERKKTLDRLRVRRKMHLSVTTLTG